MCFFSAGVCDCCGKYSNIEIRNGNADKLALAVLDSHFEAQKQLNFGTCSEYSGLKYF